MSASPDPEFWRGRRVMVTGHTGFKGAWLSLWLAEMGAEVQGFALPPSAEPSLFALAGVEHLIDHRLGDVRDLSILQARVAAFRPEVIFHLAAQSLVRASYAEPVETFATNVMGTVHLLEAVRRVGGVAATLIVTSDKCYAENGGIAPYRESDPMGGHDPYSASKGSAEIAAAGYAHAFLAPLGLPMATLRAGNVIGGGDWARDRLVVDLIQGFLSGDVPVIRSPDAIRPWQHVLEPLCGYLCAAEHLVRQPHSHPQAWNFGPDEADTVQVITVAERLRALWGRGANFRVEPQPGAPREAGVLRLDANLAAAQLGWQPKWRLDEALRQTVAWYQGFANGVDIRTLTLGQIAAWTAMTKETVR